ncbi:uncharacterized protein BX664DRAFT_335799 [Halteromyces radiatus]|uniref:uncharacterized protein n=1 Tax=Halteromyces radiatus TaxID=101107 RepID=UPI0022203CAF|nr:uncharacterized protein BX664DRAFT_335799 [Halteromyces radiatus]KAI8086438.1 hypothetical protein BX664DRAFT_335799 [Halteromyces radiatus]
MDSISEDLYSPSALVSQTKRQGIQAAHRRQQAESSTSSALQSSQKSIAEHTSNNTSDQPSDRIGIGISEIKRGWDTNINNENLPDQVGARRHLPTTIRPHRRLHSSPSRSISHRYNIWTDDEFNALKEGLRIFKGKYWIDIKKRFAERLSKRTNVDIRDKARNEARRRHLLGLPMEEFQYAF